MAQTVTHITEHVSSQVRAYMLSQGLSNVSESDLSELKLHVAYKQTNLPAKSEWTHKWNLLRGRTNGTRRVKVCHAGSTRHTTTGNSLNATLHPNLPLGEKF